MEDIQIKNTSVHVHRYHYVIVNDQKPVIGDYILKYGKGIKGLGKTYIVEKSQTQSVLNIDIENGARLVTHSTEISELLPLDSYDVMLSLSNKKEWEINLENNKIKIL